MTPDVTSVLRRNLRTALRQGRFTEAEDLLARIKEHDPLSAPTRGMELELLVRRGMTEEAWRLAEQLLKQFPESPGVLFWSGRAAYRRREYPEAQRLFRESRRLVDHWTTRQWLGKTLTQTGDLGEAEQILVPLAEERPTCRKDLAWLLERMDEPQRAIEEIEKYLEHRPDDQFALEQRTRLLALVVEEDDLVEDVEALVEMGEQVPAAMAPRYARILLSSCRGDRVREMVTRMLPGMDPRLAMQLGWELYKALEYDLAIDLWMVALPHHLRNVKLLNSLTRAARICAREDALAEAFERHVRQEPRLHGRIKKLRQAKRADEPEP